MATSLSRVAAWKEKNEQLTKAEFFKDLNQLDIKFQKLEKERNAFLQARRGDLTKGAVLQLLELETSLSGNRRNDKLKLQQEIKKTSSLVKAFRNDVSVVKPTPEFVEKIKIQMEEIESTISQFKEEQRHIYEEAQREERLLSQECSLLERKIDAWATGAVADDTGVKVRRDRKENRDVTQDLPEEVAAFERFLMQTGGRLGGWDELDHQTFLRVRQKFRGREAFLDELICVLPTRTPDAIRQHEDWYKEFLVLRDKKKESILRWKNSKAANGPQAGALNDEDEEEEEEDEEAIKRRLAQEKKLEREREERQEQLEAWRVKKEIEKQQEWAKKLEEERINRQNEMRKKKEQESIKAQVRVFQAERARSEMEKEALEMMREWEEREDRRIRIGQSSARISSRNDKFVQDKLSHRKKQEEAERLKLERQERMKANVEVNVKRDPSRLTRPTAGWEQRMKSAGEASAEGGRVLHMPHRAVPTWRQGL